MAVLIQKQVRGVFSGVAFSRDPISQQGDAVVIEGLPGDATRVVSGRVTPDQYRVYLKESRGTGQEATKKNLTSRLKLKAVAIYPLP
jgi:phosphoenolpyruvate synthase/pyruvate phosphate dikinase